MTRAFYACTSRNLSSRGRKIEPHLPAEPALAAGRSPAREQPRRRRRDPPGLEDRSAVARSARTISPDGSFASAKMGSRIAGTHTERVRSGWWCRRTPTAAMTAIRCGGGTAAGCRRSWRTAGGNFANAMTRAAMRRYRRRWIVERTPAWYDSYHRLLIRHERFPSIYLLVALFRQRSSRGRGFEPVPGISSCCGLAPRPR